MKLQPQGKRILVKRFKAKGASTIIEVVENNKEIPAEGIIQEIGTEETHLAKGDQVLFGKYAGTPIGDGDTNLAIMNYDDVIAVVNRG
jgi:co-chaperonin GroES (HSP10)